MASVFLYFAGGRLSSAELSAACLDGHLVAIGDAYTPADTVETAALRAGSLAHLVEDEFAVILESAAWVHGLIADPPHHHRLQRTTSRRGSGPRDRMVRYRDTLIESKDLVVLSGVQVATLPRTVVDLIREGDGAHIDMVIQFLTQHPLTVQDALQWLDEAPRLPNKRVARALLASMLRTT